MLADVARARPRVSVLGVGAMGSLHARVFAQRTEDFVLAGVYDLRAEAAEATALTWAVPAFASESLAIEAADLVVVASPVDAHAGAARRALASGRHVFVEKPACATAAQAYALARSVLRGQRLFVGHSERYNPVIRALRERIRPEDIRSIRLRRASALAAPPFPPRFERSNERHGALLTLGVHDLDLVAHLTASPVALRDATHVEDDRADLVLVAARGAVAWVHVDRRAPFRERSIEVVTRDAVYAGDLLAKTLRVRMHGQHESLACSLVDEEPLVAQAAAIARALRGSDEAAASGVDGARALALVEQATSRVSSHAALRALAR